MTFLVQLVDPLTVTLGLLLLALLLFATGRRRIAGAGFLLTLAWTWVLATPLAAGALTRSLEQRFPPVELAALPEADAIVVLGGGVAPPATPRQEPDLNHAADRIHYGARLYRGDKAPLVIVTGERPYPDSGPTAADAQAGILRDLGVPADAIIAPGRSTRTATDARIVREVMTEFGLDDVLLVTSALHMPRALDTFQAAGIAAFPAPTDHQYTTVPRTGTIGWLPSSEALVRSSRVFHECAGRWFYRLKGWL